MRRDCFSDVVGKVYLPAGPTGLWARFTWVIISFFYLTISLEFLFCSCFVYLIIFFIFRKVRKTSVTWVLVSLCASMLIFNLFFVFGIENSNKNIKTSNSETNNTDLNSNVMLRQDTVVISNPKCTAIAILLHYFGLATFVWMGLSAAQLYFLLIRTMKPLPQHFILFNSLIGWGKCLLLHFLRNLILLKSFNLNKHLLKT